MTPETKTRLIAARGLLSDPEKWTKHVAARNSDGVEVDTSHDSATCFAPSVPCGILAHPADTSSATRR